MKCRSIKLSLIFSADKVSTAATIETIKECIDDDITPLYEPYNEW